MYPTWRNENTSLHRYGSVSLALFVAFLDTSNSVCNSRKAPPAVDRFAFPQHWFPQHVSLDVSSVYWRHHCSWGPQERVFPARTPWVSFKLQWVNLLLKLQPNHAIFFRSLENLHGDKEVENGHALVPTHHDTLTVEGKRRISTCSGYSTATGMPLCCACPEDVVFITKATWVPRGKRIRRSEMANRLSRLTISSCPWEIFVVLTWCSRFPFRQWLRLRSSSYRKC